jgi:hypothetical protein
MDDDFPPAEPGLDRWSIPIDEPPTPPPAVAPPAPATDDTDVLHFPLSTDPPPPEGYHPRLYRFGDAA